VLRTDVDVKKDLGHAGRAEQRLEVARMKNEHFTKEFAHEIMKQSTDEEDFRTPVWKKKSRYKVIVSGSIVELYKYNDGVRYGKQDDKSYNVYGPAPNSIEDKLPPKKEKKKTADGLTIDPDTGEVIYDPMVARRANMRASKNEFRRVILSNFSTGSTFITLTFRDGSVSDLRDVSVCNKAFKEFIQSMRYKYGKFKYARVIEFQDANGRGAVHYHVIFDGLPYIHYDVLAEIWGHGFIGINRIDHVDNVGAYIRKYMAQELDDKRLMGKKAHEGSRGLVRPYEAYGDEAVELIEAYQLDQKKWVFRNSYESEHQGFTEYYEYNLNANEEYRGQR
jgi:hypothetical protein